MSDNNYKFLFSNYNKSVNKRINIVFAILGVMCMGLILRCIYINYVKGSEYKALAENQYMYIENTTDTKYKLLGCNGEELREYSLNYYAVVEPYIFRRMNSDAIKSNETSQKKIINYKEKDDLNNLIYTLRNFNKEYNLTNIIYSNPNEKVKYLIDKKTYEKLKNVNNIKGFYTYKCNELKVNKSWKIENLVSNHKEYQNDSFKKQGSLEMQIYEKTMYNNYPKIVLKKDRDFNVVEKTYVNSQNNVNVRLTLDKKVQDKIKEILQDDIYKKYDQIGVVLMEADTGKIRGMVQKDDYKSNPNIGIPSNNGFLAGSTFKTVVQEAALDKDLISLDKKYEVRRIFSKVHEKQKNYDAQEAFIQSSNDIFVQIGHQVGYDNIKKYAEAQGLLNTVLGLHDEKIGKIEANKNEVGDITNLCIGQNIRITPLEAISIPNTVINNGMYIKPRILDAYVDDENRVIEPSTKEFKTAMKMSTAEELKNQMISVVTAENGTGKQAYVNGIEVGGKTGTTEYIDNKKECSDGWFVGFFKEKEKYYSMVVFVKNIDVKNEAGGTTAAPIFRKIVESLTTF